MKPQVQYTPPANCAQCASAIRYVVSRRRVLGLRGCKDHPDRTDLSCSKIRDSDGTALSNAEIIGVIDSLESENARLRAIFPKICEALGNGSCCSADSSIDFLEFLPREIGLVTRRLGAKAATAQKELVTERRNAGALRSAALEFSGVAVLLLQMHALLLPEEQKELHRVSGNLSVALAAISKEGAA